MDITFYISALSTTSGKQVYGYPTSEVRIPVYKLSTDLVSFCDRALLNTFQNLKVSSPAPVTMASPSGDNAKYNTLYECPVSFATCVKLGSRQPGSFYFQLNIPKVCVIIGGLENRRKQRKPNIKYIPVSTHCIGCPVRVFQNLMHRSAVPPPDASNP
ncbi:hypothetical protein NQ317_008270 [Molorchus minor]|uniref:Uncharacterized protein n=1 Tax=Molorchus minor TaxID=1323400 RepID=A0ABQ9J8G1_9CUCU|nr:hypothetical protein NQ317_008270 [Molorchus minor]